MFRFYEWVRLTDYNLTVKGEPFYTDEFGRPEALVRVQEEAQAYNRQYGLPPIDHSVYYDVDQQRAGAIADAYDALPLDDSSNPLVIDSYTALAQECAAQYLHAVAHGMTFEPWTSDGEAYTDAGEDYDPYEVFRVVADIRDNRHLYYFTGGEPNVYMAKTDPRTKLSYNVMFRMIHDYYGHTAMGADFGPRGEENAWVSHMQMFTANAQRALTTETRGQNSWVNFGRQNYDATGSYLNVLPSMRPYAVQKTAVFYGETDWINKLPGK